MRKYSMSLFMRGYNRGGTGIYGTGKNGLRSHNAAWGLCSVFIIISSLFGVMT